MNAGTRFTGSGMVASTIAQSIAVYGAGDTNCALRGLAGQVIDPAGKGFASCHPDRLAAEISDKGKFG